MSKKIIKKICLFALILVTFFGFSGNLKAYYTGAVYPKQYDGINYYMNKLGERHMGDVGIYYYCSNNDCSVQGNRWQAYCIEPGVHLKPGFSTDHMLLDTYYSKGYNKFFVTSNQRAMLSYILTFAKNLGTVASVGYFQNDGNGKADTDKVFAAQGLIWEVATGERTNFNNLWPDNHTGYNCSFYDVIYGVVRNGKACNGGKNMSGIKEEYVRIINAIRGTFLDDVLGESSGGKYFRAATSTPNVVPLAYNSSTGKYTLTIRDTNFQYWQVLDNNGLDVTIGSNYVTISSSNPISYNEAKEIKISIKNKNLIKDSNGNVVSGYVYYDANLQDLIAVGGSDQERAIKVYTPSYQIEINKKASLDGTSTGENLAGAKFNVCSDSSCRNVLGTITTNSSGVATFDEIPAPGTYYVKETVAPPGYELDTTPHAITVSTSNVAGSTSYGTITINDEKKVFELTKMTVDENGNSTILDDGCGTDTYTGPTFQLRQNGESLYFKEISQGRYELADSNTEDATTDLRTCNGKLRVYALTSCNYTISETKAPEGLTLPSEPNRDINVCGSDKTISLTNGYAGLEFQKKNEDGVFLAGGKFSLQMKVNNVYRDVLLKELGEGNYTYDANLKDGDEGATYIITTKDGSEEGEEKGIARISKLPPGEYRIVEKEAPEEYELIEDKDSTALVTIKDSGEDDYYIVEMIDQRVLQNGSRASAELVVTITTGRKVPNYVVIISSLAVLLIVVIILRKKLKK